MFFNKDTKDGQSDLKGMKIIDNKRFKPWDDYHMKTKIVKNQIEIVEPKKRTSRLIQQPDFGLKSYSNTPSFVMITGKNKVMN